MTKLPLIPSEIELKQILLVEDELDLSEILRDFLNESGWTVTTSSSLSDAQERLLSTKWDCVLLDLHLADGSTEELVKKIRAHGTTPIVLMTGVLGTEAETKIQDYLHGVLAKPFAISELMKLLSQINPRD
jgi:DNA-binding response OmpR family regulator